MISYLFIDEKAAYENNVDLEAFLQAEDIPSNHPLDDFSEQKEIKFPKVNLSHHGPNFVLDKPVFTYLFLQSGQKRKILLCRMSKLVVNVKCLLYFSSAAEFYNLGHIQECINSKKGYIV